jgi:4-amino-4-deoxy-L-arabinose transferase-like glycosyltransferase
LLLTILCLVLWLPGIVSLPATDRDESRFAESSRQMLESGDFVDIRFGQVPRYKKPVGIYWAQSFTTALAGLALPADKRHGEIWTYRLPSLIGAVAAVWLTVWCASLFGAEAGFLAGLLMALSILLAAEANIATTDAVLLAAVTGMQGVLLRLYQGPIGKGLALAGWAALAIGILVKGPVAPGVAAATIVVLSALDWRRDGKKSLAWLKGASALAGFGLLVLMVAPWLTAIARQSHGAFFQQSLGNDFAAKLAGGQESHGAPPLYYLVTSSLTFWPAILFTAPAVALAIARRGEPMVRFLLAWAGGWWVLVELVPTKLVHYVLPSFPPLAILAALWLLTPRHAAAPPPPPPKEKKEEKNDEAPPPPTRGKERGRWLAWLGALQFLIGLAVLVAAPVLAPRLYGDGDRPVLWAIASVAALAGLVALGLALAGKKLAALVPAMMAAVIAVPLLTVGVAPRLSQFWISEKLAGLVKKDALAGDPPPAVAGFDEPSLMFALSPDIQLGDGKEAARDAAMGGGLALIDDRERPAFLAGLAELAADAKVVDELSGFNYARGKPEHVTVYRVARMETKLPAAPQ